MAITYATVNQKGGVGKTTTTINLATYLATFGKKILLIDIDPQGNASAGLGIERVNLERCLYDVLIGETDLASIVKNSSVAGLDLIPSTAKLAGALVELVPLEGRETKLKEAIVQVKNNYDFIFIDCPPSLSLLTVNALTAADEVIIPIQCEYYALEGISQLTQTLDLIRQGLNPGLRICGIVLTMFDSRTILSNQVAEEVKKHFGSKVFKTIVPRNVRLAESPSFGQPIIFYDHNSKGAMAYENLSREVIGNGSYV